MRIVLALVFAAIQVHGSSVQTLRGSRLEITLDMTGWTQQQGAARLHDNYERLGLFSGPKGQNLSILVDDIPRDVTDLNTLCRGSVKSYGGSQSDVKVLESQTIGDKPACLFTFPSEMSRRNLYIEMIVEGQWLEMHYSAPDGGKAIPLARRSLGLIVSSLAARRVQSQGNDIPEADITDAELALAQSRQGCTSKSKDFVCRALGAFKEGKRPSGRLTPVGVAGITMPIVFGLNVDVIETRPTYVVVSDTSATLGSLGKAKSKEEDKASGQLIHAVKAGQHPDNTNILVLAARAQTEAKPPGLAERSLVVSKGFLRETTMGLIYFSFVQPGATGMLLGVYPTP